MNRDFTHKPYEMEINIKPTDIDQLGHVNNIVYFRWVQEVAIAHWYAEASEDDRDNLLWVVTRHEIDYKRPAFTKDTIIARTWAGAASNRAFERHTELIRKSDMKLLAKVRTLWCPIDANTKKPTDIDAELYKKFSIHESNDA